MSNTPELSFDPRGFFVYVLWGETEDRPLYIGETKHWARRVGHHIDSKATAWGEVERVEVYRAESPLLMHALEARLIYDLKPVYNVANGGTAPRQPRKERDWIEDLKGMEPDALLDPDLTEKILGYPAGMATAGSVLLELRSR